ncbi:cytochrome b [Shewanella olleyana]|uniref:cytochrome b n=1 Tax=Shewanella olleyana TaxID=135626 RepID=UPI00200D4F39|nr:cytochrome b [Shewanella olleyana]MCL1068246.1 cytochrome b [Shewanella olleyana]
MLTNTNKGYGLITILIHWISALTVIGLFGLGFWMVDLTYYSSWYKTAPDIHKSVGLLLLAVTLIRLLWRFISVKPQAHSNHKPWEQQAAKWAHRALYLLMICIMISGFLISTADGRGIMVFDWFEVPSLGSFISNQEDIAGLVHEYLAYSLIALVFIHAAGAIKHQLIDKDSTLSKIIKPIKK